MYFTAYPLLKNSMYIVLRFVVSSFCVFQLSLTGEVDVTVNMEEVLSKHDGPKDLNTLVGMYLYIAVLLQENTGTHISPSSQS